MAPLIERRRAIALADKAIAAAPSPAPAQDDEGTQGAAAAGHDLHLEEELDLDVGAVSAVLPLHPNARDQRAFYIAFAKEPGRFWECSWCDTLPILIHRHDGCVVHFGTSRSQKFLLTAALHRW